MARQPHRWASKEDGPRSSNMVVVAADMAANKKVDAEADVATTTFENH